MEQVMLPNKPKQRGAIFLALMLIVLVTGSTVLLAALNNRQTAVASQQADLRREMESAKQALLAYAANVATHFGDGPGHLPCPDLYKASPPTPESDCDPTTEFLGRLPEYVELPTADPLVFHRFHLNNAYSGIDQQFWYAVSPAYLHTDNGGLQLNSTTAGALSLDLAGTDIVALIIAPGEAVDQDRISGVNDYAQYLDGDNGADLQFWTRDQSDPGSFNDVVLPITRAELWSFALTEVAKAIKVRLDNHYPTCSTYPRNWQSPTTCLLSFSSAITNFRTVMNSTSTPAPAPTWIMSDSTLISGEQNWMGVVNSYTGNSASANVTFSGCTALTFTFNFPSNTTTRTGDHC